MNRYYYEPHNLNCKNMRNDATTDYRASYPYPRRNGPAGWLHINEEPENGFRISRADAEYLLRLYGYGWQRYQGDYRTPFERYHDDNAAHDEVLRDYA